MHGRRAQRRLQAAREIDVARAAGDLRVDLDHCVQIRCGEPPQFYAGNGTHLCTLRHFALPSSTRRVCAEQLTIRVLVQQILEHWQQSAVFLLRVRTQALAELERQRFEGLPLLRRQSVRERPAQETGERLRDGTDGRVLFAEQRRQIAVARFLQPRKQVALLKFEMARDLDLDRGEQRARERRPLGIAHRGWISAGAAGDYALDAGEQLQRCKVLFIQPPVCLTPKIHALDRSNFRAIWYSSTTIPIYTLRVKAGCI